MRSKNLKWLCVLLIVLEYAIFLMLKINGFFDFSAKYKIEHISCTQVFDNALFVIDNDDKTTWGESELHSDGEVFDIKFREDRAFHSVIINNNSNKNPTANIKIYISNDGVSWNECRYEKKIKNGTETYYTFNEECYGDHLRLVYANREAGYWPITEIQIY